MKRTAIIQQLLTRKDIAFVLQICVHTVAIAVRKKLLKEIKFNARLLRYHPEDVIDYIFANYPLTEQEKKDLLTNISAIKGRNQGLYKPDNNAIQTFGVHEAKNAPVSQGNSAEKPRKIAKTNRKGGSAVYTQIPHAATPMPVFWLVNHTRALDSDHNDDLGLTPTFMQFPRNFFRTIVPKLSLSYNVGPLHCN